MQHIKNIIKSEGLTAMELDLTVDDELFVRTRIEMNGNRGRAFYFVRSGDTAERGDGACTADDFNKITKELLELATDDGTSPTIGFRLTVNDKVEPQAISNHQLTAIAESLANHVDELSLLDNFKQFMR